MNLQMDSQMNAPMNTQMNEQMKWNLDFIILVIFIIRLKVINLFMSQSDHIKWLLAGT
jgi:hypothetical protein